MERGGLPKEVCTMIPAVRSVVVVQAMLHIGLLGISTLMAAVSAKSGCPRPCLVAATLVAIGCLCRLVVMVGLGFTQAFIAGSMTAPDAVLQQRIWYSRWHLWSRFGSIVMILQLIGAVYLSSMSIKRQSNNYGGQSTYCASMLAWMLVVSQCCIASNILGWRQLYEEHHEAWRAHYREMFSHGIQELLCCLGKWKYLHTLAGDEVDSVASLLGELVSYRASGASHLEFLAGISLLQVRRPRKSQFLDESCDAPDTLITEATLLHPYAVAAYTGLLLDFGRHPFGFLCCWFHRQGLLTPWNHSRRAIIEGDNWWRGHAAAFLKGSQLPPEALLKGRVHQKHRETVYFVAVVQHLRCIVIAVRGTESPEDLLTDGLCRECTLSDSDLSGLMNCSSISESLKRKLDETKPHFAHAGVLEAARELALQLDSLTDGTWSQEATNSLNFVKGDDGSSRKKGFLSSLVGPSGKYESYAIRFVGHSLGGSIAAITAMLLYIRHPSLHVYTYGVLPCLDLLTSEACNEFTTSVVYNDEFSSRLSVASITRLRASALQALATDAGRCSTMVTQIARQFTCSQKNKKTVGDDLDIEEVPNVRLPSQKITSTKHRRLEYMLKGGLCLCYYTCHSAMHTSKYSSSSPLHDATANVLVYKQHEIGAEAHSHPSAKALDTFLNVEDISKIDHKLPGEFSVGSADQVSNTQAVSQHDDFNNNGSQILFNGIENNSLTSSREIQGMYTPNNMGSWEQRGEQGENDLQKYHQEVPPTASISEDYKNAIVNRTRNLDEMFPVELFIPGLVIHIVCDDEDGVLSSTRIVSKMQPRSKTRYRAILRQRESFKDIVISPSMFLDHMPWRCQHALKAVMDQQVSKALPVDLV
ncbi:hypothetical protein O6H91_16G035500 [Diphasiastrum complanatum]|uniref:Uncharacterized protein n=1 Tax=Diphasiastrum complanatum TaxID=34168 RepID=A0ACC2BBH0_DIPCM|nr:hypothetical protein O6H91_16G035500 [Diphasiastrum complanatum]